MSIRLIPIPPKRDAAAGAPFHVVGQINPPFMRSKSPSLPALVLSVLALPAVASPVAYEPFDYTPGSGLTGLSGGSGWTEAWRHRNPSPGVSPLITADSLSYTDADGGSLVTSGGALETKNGTATSIAFRQIARRTTETWISFLMRPALSGDFVGLTVYDGGDDNAANSRFGVEQRESGARSVRLVNSEPTPNASILSPIHTAPAGETIFVVIRMTPGAGTGGQDRLDVFYNPLLHGNPITPAATLSIVPGGFDRVRVAATNGRSAGYDEVRIGDSYPDVAPSDALAEEPGPDGLTPSQRSILGLDPAVSHTTLAQAIRANPGFLGLFRREEFLEQPGAFVVEAPASGVVPFSFRIRESGDLIEWTSLQTFSRPIDMPNGRSFFKVTFGNR